MNKFFTALLMGSLLLLPPAARAQYYCLPHLQANHNPGDLNTDGEDFAHPGAAWQVVLTGTSTLRTAPAWSPVQSLPTGFNFRFAGQPVRQFKVSSTGVLTFDVAATSVPGLQNAALPSSQVPARSVCVWGLTMGANSSLTTQTSYVVIRMFGTAPRRQFWVQLRTFFPRNGNTTTRTNWSMVLEESTNAIYVVDQRTRQDATDSLQLTVGVQVSATQAMQVAGSPRLNSRTRGTALRIANGSPFDNSYYTFVPGTQVTRDLEMETLALSRYVVAGAGPLTLRGRLRNAGTQPVTGYTLGWRVNNGPVQTRVISGRHLNTADPDSFTLPAAWTPPAAGVYTLRCWANRPNGQADLASGNDTLTRQVLVAAQPRPRTSLLEMFTSSTCPPCLSGNDTLHAVTSATPGRWVQIKYPQNFPGTGDPYTTAENIGRFQWSFGAWIPFLLVDGHDWGGYVQQFTTNTLNYYRAQPAVLDLDAVFTVQGNTVRAQARLTPYLSVPANELVAHFVVVEKTTFNNVGTNGETEFHDQMKKMLPDADGTTLGALVNQRALTLTQSYTFPAQNTVEDFDSLQVVVFVQDPLTHEVLQAVAARHNGILGLAADAADEVGLRVVPNPAVGQATVRFTLPTAAAVTVELVDALGRTVRHEPLLTLPAGDYARPLDLKGLPPGIYLMRLHAGAYTCTRRLVVE